MDKVKGITVSSCFVSFLVWHYWPDRRLSWAVWYVLSKLVIIHWKETNYSSTSSTEENKLQLVILSSWKVEFIAVLWTYCWLKVSTSAFPSTFPLFYSLCSSLHRYVLPLFLLSLPNFLLLLLLLFFFAFLSFSHSPPSLDVGSWWSSNGVYGEPAFTTSEANRQVSSVFLAHCGPCSHSLHAPLYYHHLQQLHLQKALSAPSPAPLIHASQAEFSTASFWCVPLFNMLPSFVKALLRQQILTKITAHARL